MWLTQAQLAEIYDITQQNISQHVDRINSDGELDRKATNKKFLSVRKEETHQVKRNIDHYNLDMIIALGYRVQSLVATRFRRCATKRLYEYIQKIGSRWMTMKDCIDALDRQIVANRRKLLQGSGSVSHKEAMAKAEKELEIYHKREKSLYESDFDKMIKLINSADKK